MPEASLLIREEYLTNPDVCLPHPLSILAQPSEFRQQLYLLAFLFKFAKVNYLSLFSQVVCQISLLIRRIWSAYHYDVFVVQLWGRTSDNLSSSSQLHLSHTCVA
jgi:hypothetical protein